MNLFAIAWRNIWRNVRRSLLSALAVAAACALLVFMMAMQRGSYVGWIDNTARARTGHFQVQALGYLEDRDLSLKVEDPRAVIELMKVLPGVVGIAPRINAPALISRGKRSFGGLIFGIDPELEAETSTLDEVIREGEFLTADDRDGVLLSKILARNLEAGIGDEIVFMGQGADGSIAAGKLIVRGIFEFGMKEIDRVAAAAHLETVNEAYSMMGGATEIAVLLESDTQRAGVVAQVNDLLRDGGFKDTAALGWPELLPGMEQSIKMDWNSGLIMYAVLVLVVGFGVANTFLMAYMERIHEYGVLISIGMKPHLLGLLAYLESILLILFGLGLGLAAGIPITGYFEKKGLDFSSYEDAFAEWGMDPVIYPLVCREAILWSVGLIGVISLVMAIYPAFKAFRLRPVEALRHR